MALFKQHLGLLIAKETSSGDQRSESYIASSQDFQRRNFGEKQKGKTYPVSSQAFPNIGFPLMLNSQVFVENSCIVDQNVWRPKLNSYITVWAENPSKSIAPMLRSWWDGYFGAKPAAKVDFS